MAKQRSPSSLCIIYLSYFAVLSSLSNRSLVGAAIIKSGDAGNVANGASSANSSTANGGFQICSQNVSSFFSLPYQNISNFACTGLWNNFVLRYHNGDANVSTFILSAPYTAGWVGMGFSKDGMMVGSSAMVGWVNKKGKLRIRQFSLRGYNSSKVVVDKGDLDLTKVPPAVVIHSARIHMAFRIRFATPLDKQPVILAFGMAYPNRFRLPKHDDQTTIIFDFSKAVVGMNVKGTRKTHGALGTLAWGLFLPIGAVVARYLRHRDPLWFYLHSIIQCVGFLLCLATVVLGVRLYSSLHANIPIHRGIGIFVLTVTILQVLAFIVRPKDDAKIRRYWNWYHHWFGRIALFFGAVNVAIGIHEGNAGTAWKILFGFMVAAVLVVVVILEVLSRVKSDRKIPSET